MTNKKKTKPKQENTASRPSLKQQWTYCDHAMDDILSLSDDIATMDNILLSYLSSFEYISFKHRLYGAYKNIQRITELIAHFEKSCDPTKETY